MRLRVVIWATAAVAATHLLAVQLCEAAVLCQHTKSGKVAVREAECKRKEVPLDLTPFVGERPTAAPKVVDSQGQEVGLVVGPASQWDERYTGVFVMRDQGGTRVGFNVFRSEISPAENGDFVYFYHETPDCSSTRYVPADKVIQEAQRAFSGGVGTWYYASSPLETRTILAHERLFHDGQDPNSCANLGGTVVANGRCCQTFAADQTLVGPAAIIDLPVFTPPFRVE